MKKIVTTSLIAFTMLFAQTDITFTKSFNTKVKPDTLTTNISFNVQRLSQAQTTDKLTKISEFVSGEKSVKAKGGEYSVNPHMVYENSKSRQDGYDGTISYQLSSKNATALNKFSRELQRYAEKNGMTTSVSSASWSRGDSDGDELGELRLEAIQWSEKYAKTLSSKLGKSCSVSKINFSDNGGRHYPQPAMMKASMASDSAPTPTQDEQNISTNAHIEMVCK